MKPEQQRQADTDIPPEIEAIAAEGIKLFSRLINVASKSMTDPEFDRLCEAHSFGAVARNEFPLVPRAMLKALVDAAVPRAMLKALVDAAVSTEILKQQERIKDSVKRLESTGNALVTSADAEIGRLRKANLQLREGAEEQKQRIKRLEAGDAALSYSIGLDLQKENDALKDRIKRLEEAGDKMEPWCSDLVAASNWEKAKEAKP